MSELDNRHGPYVSPNDKEVQRGWAFFVAAAVATMLYVGAFVLYRELPALLRDPNTGQVLFMLRIYLIQLLVAAIPASLTMMILVVPAYNLLRLFNKLTSTNILIGSFIAGILAAYLPMLLGSAIVLDLRGEEQWTWSHIAGSLIIALPGGVCALIGGLLFCRMTVWRKPEAGGASHAPE
ncbi:MAG: hypothetical protein ACLFV8_11060 [Alphaproteobacteria bacterium]